jgi:hypothetical protein
MFHKIARVVKLIQLFILTIQGQILQKITFKRLGYTGQLTYKGCTVEIKEAEKCSQQQLDEEVELILKNCKCNPQALIKFFEGHNTPVYQVKDVVKKLKPLRERKGLITERTGYVSLRLNMMTSKKIKFNSPMMIVLEEGEPYIYFLMHALHKWCAVKNGLEGLDEKSQKTMLRFNVKNKKSLAKLSLNDIKMARAAIKRDVQAIDFVLEYSKKHAGAKQALDKLKNEGGISI